ncbi:MAG: hypothetical protein J6K72_09860 [Clostridia bacterium]|nr:hypothetical protein [Clostridia bacterium]
MMKRLLVWLLIFALMLPMVGSAEEETVTEAPLLDFWTEVTYGHYEQDENLDNGQEPIEWHVLEVKGNYVFLLSKYCLETRIFNENPNHDPCYWGKSKIRKWMNEDFLNAAFTPEEQEMIRLTTVDNHNPHGMKGGGDDTYDKIYFLSRVECLKYMPEMEDRIAYPTQHAIATGCEVNEKNGACYWWLRTPGDRNVDIQGVRPTGKIAHYGKQDVWWKTNTVRPCMWVHLEAFRDLLPADWEPLPEEPAPVIEAEVEEETPPPFPEFGSIVTYGQYEQDEDLENGQEPIEWLVLETKGEKVLLLSKYCLETLVFSDDPNRLACPWGKSSIRTWMNQDFVKAAFSEAEKDQILETTVKNHNPHGVKGGGDDTLDLLFLLSREEAIHYMPEMKDRIAYPTRHAIAAGCEVGKKNSAGYWWLRTPGASDLDVQVVRPTGQIGTHGKQRVWSKINTVRPCMWVSMDAFRELLPEGWEPIPEEIPVVEEPDRVSQFYTFDMLAADFEKWGQLEHDWLKTEVIGQTVEDRPMYALTIGTGDVYALVFAGIHGNEIANTPIMMDALENLIEGMENGDEVIKETLSRVTLVVVPCANPDGYDYCVGYARRGMVAGRKVNHNSVNLNRNFPTPHWGNEFKMGEADYPGPEGGSEPETQALVKLAERYPYSAMVDFHSKGRDVYYGKGGFEQPDILVDIPVDDLNAMTLRLAEAIQPNRYGLRLMKDSEKGEGFGGSTDYLFHLGVPAVTVETVDFEIKTYTVDVFQQEAKQLQMPDLLMKLCDIACEFDKELHPAGK